ncbi:MAG: hypothetical protein KY458_11930 [Actinobacteria bacterium]|nr:hypothetical protein [Actinomycetota bacterium]
MRPLWLRLLIAVVFFVVSAVILVPAWLVIVIMISLEFGATLGGPGEAAHGPTVEWFDPVAYTSLGVVIVSILFMTWKVFHQPDRVLRRLNGFRRTGHSGSQGSGVDRVHVVSGGR